jgi:hypothetical protein
VKVQPFDQLDEMASLQFEAVLWSKTPEPPKLNTPIEAYSACTLSTVL